MTLFRVYPHGIDTFTIKERERSDPQLSRAARRAESYNRRVFERVQAEALSGHGIVISMTDAYIAQRFRHAYLGAEVVRPFTLHGRSADARSDPPRDRRPRPGRRCAAPLGKD